MGKQWVRQQIRHDEMHDVVDKGLLWIEKNRQTAAMGAGAIVVVAIILVATFSHARNARAQAWDRLSLAQSYAYSGVPQAALAQFDQLRRDHPNSDAAGFATVFAGDVHFQRAEYKEAADEYSKIIERGLPKGLQPVALADLAITQESAGQAQQAAQTAQRFLDAFPDHYLAPQVHACLARSLLAAGQKDQAKAAFQKISLQYPDTSWAAWAQSQLKSS